MFKRIDPRKQDEVIWLQRALTRLLRSPYPVHIGEIDPLTFKALRTYQLENALPVTLDIDETTLEHIEQQLKKRGLTIS